MTNIYESSFGETADGLRAARLGEQAGCRHLGMSLYELAPGDGMVFHYHVQREELLIVLAGRPSLRTAVGWEELPEGEIVAFPRGERGAHGYRNDTDTPVRLLMIGETNGPNISVYPDTNQVGIFDAAHRTERRFGALFNVVDAVGDYGGGNAQIVPPAPGPTQEQEPSHGAARMTAADVIEVLECLDAGGVTIWVDGGWGVDALVGEETREHMDLDLAISRDQVRRAQAAVEMLGFGHDPTVEPGLPARLVLRDGRGRQVDFHPLVFDGTGGWQQLSETARAWGRYPSEHLQATGVIADRRVRCLSPELQFRFRLTHEWTSRDEHDLRVLAERFDVGPVPPPLSSQGH